MEGLLGTVMVSLVRLNLVLLGPRAALGPSCGALFWLPTLVQSSHLAWSECISVVSWRLPCKVEVKMNHSHHIFFCVCVCVMKSINLVKGFIIMIIPSSIDY